MENRENISLMKIIFIIRYTFRITIFMYESNIKSTKYNIDVFHKQRKVPYNI